MPAAPTARALMGTLQGPRPLHEDICVQRPLPTGSKGGTGRKKAGHLQAPHGGLQQGRAPADRTQRAGHARLSTHPRPHWSPRTSLRHLRRPCTHMAIQSLLRSTSTDAHHACAGAGRGLHLTHTSLAQGSSNTAGSAGYGDKWCPAIHCRRLPEDSVAPCSESRA